MFVWQKNGVLHEKASRSYSEWQKSGALHDYFGYVVICEFIAIGKAQVKSMADFSKSDSAPKIAQNAKKVPWAMAGIFIIVQNATILSVLLIAKPKFIERQLAEHAAIASRMKLFSGICFVCS